MQNISRENENPISKISNAIQKISNPNTMQLILTPHIFLSLQDSRIMQQNRQCQILNSHMLYGKIIITRRDTYSSFKAPCKRWDAALQRCFYKKVFWNYAANLQENTHIEVWFQQSCKFAGYFHNVFSYEHLWRAASGAIHLTVKYQIETMTNVTNSSWRTFTFNEVRVLTKNSISKYRGTLHV